MSKASNGSSRQKGKATGTKREKSKTIKTIGQCQVGPYKGYVGLARFDSDDNDFFGHVIGIRDVVTFQASFDDLAKEFKISVDTYLDLCREQGKQPDKPFSGKFNVRIPSELHRLASMRAEAEGTSLNQLVVSALEQHVSK